MICWQDATPHLKQHCHNHRKTPLASPQRQYIHILASIGTFELVGNTLRYEMEMQTTRVERSTPHLKIALQREKQ